MGDSFNRKQREDFRKGKKGGKGSTGKGRLTSESEQEVIGIIHLPPVSHAASPPRKEQSVTRSVQPPGESRVLNSEPNKLAGTPVGTPTYKDLAGVGKLTRYARGLGEPASPTPTEIPKNAESQGHQELVELGTERYKQSRDPSVNVLPDDMMEIVYDRPLRGEVKFFDARKDKLFGFIIVDPLDVTPVQIAVMTVKERLSLRRKETFFSYYDVGQPVVQEATDTCPTIVERRNMYDFNPPYPKQGDRIVFFPILVPGPGPGGKRSKAVPWAYEKEWDAAAAEVGSLNAD